MATPPKLSSSSSKLNNSMKQTTTDDSSRNRLPQRKRIFTDNDEILILKGFSDFNSKIGNYTIFTHHTAFYNSIKDSLSFKPTQRQFSQRIWKLKNKFDIKKNKNVPTFTTPHELELFQLSHKLWGQDKDNGKLPKKPVVSEELESVVVDNKNPVVSEELESVVVDKDELSVKRGSTDIMVLREMLRFHKMRMGHVNVLLKRKMELICMGDVNVLKRKMKLIGESERVEFDGRFKKLKVQEMKLLVERFELAKESVDSMFKEGLQG